MSVLAVHHSTKKDEVERGHNALRAAADTMMKLPKGGRVRLVCDKQRDDELFADIPLDLRPAGASLVVVGSLGDESGGGNDGELRGLIEEAVREHGPLNQSQLRDHLRPRRAEVVNEAATAAAEDPDCPVGRQKEGSAWIYSIEGGTEMPEVDSSSACTRRLP